MNLFTDTETSGKFDFKADFRALHQPNLVQLAAMLTDNDYRVLGEVNLIIRPEDWTISEEVAAIHGIDQNLAMKVGVPRKTALSAFNQLARVAESLVAHNLNFDYQIMQTAFYRIGIEHRMGPLKQVCTMLAATPVLKLPKPFPARRSAPGDAYKWPKLEECHRYFFNEGIAGAHDAMVDVRAMVRVHRALREIGAI